MGEDTLKITDIKTYPIWVGHRNQLVVKVETDEGIYGLGDEEFFPSQLTTEGDHILVPDGPSLGVTFSEEAAKEQEFKMWEAPHLRRQDGSHTNW